MIRPLSAPFAPSLASLVPGQEAAITSLTGPDNLRRRLMEIGFVPGSTVRFEMATPFGDPLVFTLRGSKIALRRCEAQCIHTAFQPSR